MSNWANENTRERRGSTRRRWILSLALAATITTEIVTSTSGHCGIVHSIRAAFKGHLNHVATKIAELRDKNPDLSPRGMSFSADGENIAVDSAHASINVWDWRSRRIVRTLDTPLGFVSGLSIQPIQYSPDGQMLAACEGKGVGNVVIRVWNARNWSLVKDIVDTGPGMGCRSMVFTPDGKFLIYAVFRIIKKSELVAYSTDSWRIAWRLQIGAGPRDDIEPEGLAASPDGKFLAISGTASILMKPAALPRSLGQIIQKPIVDIVDLSQKATTVKTYYGTTVGSIAWSPDGSRIVVAGGERLDMFEVMSGRRASYENDRGTAHTTVAFAQGGRYLIESDMNGRGTGLGVSIWDAGGEKQLQRIPGNSGGEALTRDGSYLAIGGVGNTTIWQLR